MDSTKKLFLFENTTCLFYSMSKKVTHILAWTVFNSIEKQNCTYSGCGNIYTTGIIIILVRRTVMCSNGLEREFFLAPDGSSFSGRKQSLEFMKKSGTASEEDIRRMESGCKVVWSCEDPTLPPGWKTRESVINSRYRYLQETKTNLKMLFII